MSDTTILIVDDDKVTRRTLSMALDDDYTTTTAGGGAEALEILGREEINLILSDLDMPGMSGIELLQKINQLEAPPPVIFITGQGTIETAVQAMKLGAYDYVSKPVNLDRLMLIINKTLENKDLKEENIRLKKRLKESLPEVELIGAAPAMKKVVELAMQVAPTKATVLIEGESGTGKELITNLIHYHSPVAHGPFIKVNCSAFSEGVLESELFGHEKGAFTGAINTKKGRFELADKGTLFLDEVGEMPPSIQVKLLRFLQEKTFERVGGTKTLKVDIRIISATNKNLEELVKEGKFRDDLYYRLRVIKFEIPPLRKRTEDIPALVDSYIRKFSDLHGIPITGISAEAMAAIMAYNWPGNVRELVNCIESCVVMSRGKTIDVESLPEYLTDQTIDAETDMEGGMLQELERKAITEVLVSTSGDKTKAAKILGIGLRTLYRKVEKYGLPY